MPHTHAHAHAHTAPSPGTHSDWLALGLAAAVLTVIQAARHGASARTVALAFSNIAHRIRGPLTLLAAGASWPGSAALVAGVRTPEGFQRG
jgi:hypothetical protein